MQWLRNIASKKKQETSSTTGSTKPSPSSISTSAHEPISQQNRSRARADLLKREGLFNRYTTTTEEFRPKVLPSKSNYSVSDNSTKKTALPHASFYSVEHASIDFTTIGSEVILKGERGVVTVGEVEGKLILKPLVETEEEYCEEEQDLLAQEVEEGRRKLLYVLSTVQDTLAQLDERASILKERKAAMSKLDGRTAHNVECAGDVVKVDLRGRVFEINKASLLRFQTSKLYALLSTGATPTRDGAFFFDRPYEGFSRIADYIETGSLDIETLDEYEEDCVANNFQYFALELPPMPWDYSLNDALVGHEGTVYSVTQLSDGRICSASDDKSIKIWSTVTMECEATLVAHTDAVLRVVQLKDGRICSCSFDETIRFWDVQTHQCTMTLEGHLGPVFSVIALKDGSRICSCSVDKTIRVWRCSSGDCERILQGHTGEVVSLVQLKDWRVASGAEDETVMIWSLVSGSCEAVIFTGGGAVWSLTQLSDSRLCSCLANGTIDVWNLGSGTCEEVLRGHSDQVLCSTLLQDGKLCTGGYTGDTALRLWNTHSDMCELELPGHTDSVWTVIQLSDGRLCSSSVDKSIRIWY